MGLLLQPNAKYDPIFKATTEVLYLYAGWIWEARGSLHHLQTAWRHMRSRMDKSESWAKVRGPLAVVWLSLKRIGWSMHSADMIVTDSNTHFSLLQVAPPEISATWWNKVFIVGSCAEFRITFQKFKMRKFG